MAAGDARPVLRKNVAARIYFPILDADGDLVSGASGLDSEVSLDGAAFGDCTNEATEIGSSGIYYLDLTAGETNADAICLIVKTSTSGAKTTPMIFYPEEAGDLRLADNQKVDVHTLKTQALTVGAGVTIYAHVGEAAANVAQTGDSFARIGANGASLTALATAAQVSGLAINTRANLQLPVEIETPDSSTQVYKIRLHLFDVEGNMEAPDSTPTIALTNAAGTDRSSRLSAASNPSTGVYTWDYTATAGDAEEQLVWVFTVVEGGATRTYPATSYVVEHSAYRFSSSDRAALTAAAADAAELNDTKLTTARAGYLDELAAANLPADVDQIKAAVDSEIASIISSLASLATAVADIPTNSELATALAAADDAVLALVTLVKETTDKLDDTLEDDSGVYRFTTNALEQAPTGGGGGDVTTIRDLLEADRYIDTAQNPWQLVLIKAGTGNLATGTRLLVHNLRSTAGAALVSTDTVVGQSVAP